LLDPFIQKVDLEATRSIASRLDHPDAALKDSPHPPQRGRVAERITVDEHKVRGTARLHATSIRLIE